MLLFSTPAWGQFVTITGTVVDPNGCPYVNGTASAVLLPSNVQYFFGNNPATNIRPVWQLDSFGRFSIQLYETDLLSPTSPTPQWQFRFNSAQVVSPVQVGTINFTMQPLSLLTSQDISALIQAQAAPLPPGCGQPSAGTIFNCNSPVVGANAFSLGGPTPIIGCDPLMIDTTGTMTGLQFNAISPWNGELKVTAVNTGPPQALPTHSSSWTAPNVIPSSYRNVMPSAPCTATQVWQVFSITTDGTGTTNQNWNCGNGGGGGGGVQAQVNGVNNLNCSGPLCPLINAINSPTITATNPSGGQWQFSINGTGTLANPTTPTVTALGTTGATQYCYLIVGVEDASLAYHSAPTTATCISNGNATLASTGCPSACTAANLISAYIDTTYGYRGVIVCRTTGGATQGVITSGLLAGKRVIDTGLTANGANCAALYATNNTLTYPWCLGSSLPGYPTVPGAPCGVDGPPLTPFAPSAENGETFSSPGGVNDGDWLFLNQNSATATWTNGAILLQAPGRGVADNLNCLEQTITLPATPYSFVTLVYGNWATGQSSHNNQVGFGLYESATGKIQTVGNQSASTNNRYLITSWNNTFTSPTFTQVGDEEYWPYQVMNYGLSNDGSHITYYSSPDGIHYQQVYQSTVTNFFTTAPNHLVFCVNANNGQFSTETDYIRQVTSIP